MTVRRKLVVSALLMAVPLAILLGAIRHRLLDMTAIKIYAAAATSYMYEARAACEATPDTWSRRLTIPLLASSKLLPGTLSTGGDVPSAEVRLFAFDAALHARSRAAPPLSREFARASRDGAVASARVFLEGPPRIRDVLIRMPWGTGPCAYVLVRSSEPAGSIERLLGPPGVLVGPPLLILLVVLIASGPLVQRIRVLTHAVRESARGNYLPTVSLRGGDELSELARAFDAAGRDIRAQIALQARRERAFREFIENTTHDLATPLAVLHGHLAALRDAFERDAPALRQDVSGAVCETHYIKALLHNLTVAAQLDVGKAGLLLGPVNLSEIVERVANRHRIVAQQQSVSVERAIPSEPIFVVGDVTMIEQAVGNVVLNAVRYNKPGGNVAVVLETAEAGRFRLRTVDDGPGLAEAYLAKITARGVRGDDAASRMREGQGLGLHIAMRVAALHGFEMRLERARAGGLDVCFEGPILTIASDSSCIDRAV